MGLIAKFVRYWKSNPSWQRMYVLLALFLVIPAYISDAYFGYAHHPQETTVQYGVLLILTYFVFWISAAIHPMLVEGGYETSNKSEYMALRYIFAIGFTYVGASLFLDGTVKSGTWENWALFVIALALAHELVTFLIRHAFKYVIGLILALWLMFNVDDTLKNLTTPGAIILGACIIAWAIAVARRKE